MKQYSALRKVSCKISENLLGNTCNRVKNLFAAGVFAVRYVKFLERFFYKTPEKDCFSAMRGNYFSGLKILGR